MHLIRIKDRSDTGCIFKAGGNSSYRHPGESDPIEHSGCSAEKQEKKAGGKNDLMPGRCHPRSYSWSELLKRVFEIDILKC
jgi:hypothetical protein